MQSRYALPLGLLTCMLKQLGWSVFLGQGVAGKAKQLFMLL